MGRILPILFNTGMVQEILDGRKTVTRRVIKVPPYYPYFYKLHDNSDGALTGTKNRLSAGFYDEDKILYIDGEKHIDAVYYQASYQPGDILYVRETWALVPCIECRKDGCCGRTPVLYEARDAESEGCYIYRAGYARPESITWHPSIHMPRKAARIWLKVTDVRVERLQEMTLGDFMAEGVVIRPEAFNDPDNACMQARNQFIEIWDPTIPRGQQALYSWDADPWVWVIGFERCGKPEGET